MWSWLCPVSDHTDVLSITSSPPPIFPSAPVEERVTVASSSPRFPVEPRSSGKFITLTPAPPASTAGLKRTVSFSPVLEPPSTNPSKVVGMLSNTVPAFLSAAWAPTLAPASTATATARFKVKLIIVANLLYYVLEVLGISHLQRPKRVDG